MAVLFISIGRMSGLAPTPNTVALLFAMVMAPGFYLHHVEVVDQDQLVAIYKRLSSSSACS